MTIIARWESRGKKYWVEVRKNDYTGSFSYATDSGGGTDKDLPSVMAKAELQTTFAPSKMKRVF